MPLRIEYAGACYHVINRGNYRRNLFAELRAGEAFETALGEAATKYRWRIHAYVIMRNHFHLALELTEPNLSEGMQWLQATWARRYNAYRKIIGKPFQGRYKALLVERGKSLGQVCHYIHLNPVRAGVVAVPKLPHYSLSSLPKFVEKRCPSWLDATTVLQAAGELSDNRKGWQRYLEYLEFLVSDPSSKKELSADRLSRGWCIGDESFRTEMRNTAREKGIALERGRFEGLAAEELQGEKAHAWEEHLQQLARAAKISLATLGSKKSDPAKVLLAAAMKQGSSAPNAWLADRLKMGKPASVSQFCRRFLLIKEGKKQVAALESKLSLRKGGRAFR